MKLHELTQQGSGDAADYFRERDRMYGRTELRVPAVFKPQTEDVADTPAPTTFGDLMVTLAIVPGISQQPRGTSFPGSSPIRPDSGKPQSNEGIVCLPPHMESDSSPKQNVKSVEPVSYYRYILPPQPITL